MRKDNQQLASSDRSGTVRLWNLADGAPQGELNSPGGAVTGLAYHPNNQALVTTSGDGTLR